MTVSPIPSLGPTRADVRAILDEADDRAWTTEKLADKLFALFPVEAGDVGGWQDRCKDWLLACFGPETLTDVPHRTARFLEEALELAQAAGFTVERAHAVVDYVYGRDAGDVNQEVGGVMMTLAAHCIATGHDMTAEGERELARVWTKVDQIRAKEAAKPSFAASPPLAEGEGK